MAVVLSEPESRPMKRGVRVPSKGKCVGPPRCQHDLALLSTFPTSHAPSSNHRLAFIAGCGPTSRVGEDRAVVFVARHGGARVFRLLRRVRGAARVPSNHWGAVE